MTFGSKDLVELVSGRVLRILHLDRTTCLCIRELHLADRLNRHTAQVARSMIIFVFTSSAHVLRGEVRVVIATWLEEAVHEIGIVIADGRNGNILCFI